MEYRISKDSLRSESILNKQVTKKIDSRLAIWAEFCWECIEAEVQMGDLEGSPRGIPSGDLSGGV